MEEAKAAGASAHRELKGEAFLSPPPQSEGVHVHPASTLDFIAVKPSPSSSQARFSLETLWCHPSWGEIHANKIIHLKCLEQSSACSEDAANGYPVIIILLVPALRARVKLTLGHLT